VAEGKKQWLINVVAYTLAGGMASVFVGSALSTLGGALLLLLPALRVEAGRLGVWIAIAIATVAIAREARWISLPLPQLRRQTKQVWAILFPRTVAATLWGLDLGLIFTTRLTFSGVWLLAAVAFLNGEPVFGATLFGLYWLGRALSVWIAPLLMQDTASTPQLMDGIAGEYRLFRRVHVLGLIWSVFALFAWFTYGS
jgi:hypothetical protein